MRIAGSLGRSTAAAYRKFYIDEVYLFITKSYCSVGSARRQPGSTSILDGLVNATGWAAETVSNKLKIIQSGRMQYAVYFLAGVLLMAVLFIYMALKQFALFYL